ncbi:MAG: MBL fold metallo-hydrolase [Deltaproteobacteria bacterium]|jgi:glyoxylase-like metal-dependent hydrolase (beta-lactamase superfamily II)|nr:MBL fold metallo-hydrolase [Deltaproteobacteria bacterium]
MNYKKSLLRSAILPALFLAGSAAVSIIGCSTAPVKKDGNLNDTSASPQIYTFESDANGFNTKNFFYDNGQEVVVFDTQFTAETAKKSLEFLRTKTQNPITFVVVTHPNPDKFNGMSVFQEQGAKVVASRATSDSMKGVHDYKKYYFVQIAKMFTEETYPKLSQVDVVFDQSYEIKLRNGETVELSELSSSGVSSNQTVAYLSGPNALFVGDLVHHNAHAWLEGGIVNAKPVPAIKGWIAGLNELSKRFGSKNPKVYGGRGEAAELNVAASAQIAYLKKADSIVTKYVSALGAQKTELQTEKAGQHYLALQSVFESAFPEYTLGYMIQYGVYGLANTK